MANKYISKYINRIGNTTFHAFGIKYSIKKISGKIFIYLSDFSEVVVNTK